MLVAVQHKAPEVVMDHEVGSVAHTNPGSPDVDTTSRAEADQPKDVKKDAVLALWAKDVEADIRQGWQVAWPGPHGSVLHHELHLL